MPLSSFVNTFFTLFSLSTANYLLFYESESHILYADCFNGDPVYNALAVYNMLQCLGKLDRYRHFSIFCFCLLFTVCSANLVFSSVGLAVSPRVYSLYSQRGFSV